MRVVKPVILCAPVAKNGVAPEDKRTHLLCYTLENAKAANKRVRVTNQFGKLILSVGQGGVLCVPSLKEVLLR